ncbi:protease La [Escherichia coli]|uniref:Protease La n=1 Tax=Escherichia coli TaxID=562 RepID=A0A376VLR2_ECOLX|nr:protease La [Escherichia coli]
MLQQREWREGFLAERMQDEILQEQILIETEGERIGQINALSVIEFPGHPRAFGEPSRISCVVHIAMVNSRHRTQSGAWRQYPCERDDDHAGVPDVGTTA